MPVATTTPSRRNATSSTASSTSGLEETTTVVRPGPVAAQPGRDPGLGVRVDRRGRLDQDQDLGVAGQRPGQHQPLPLAAGEGAAALGHHRVQPVGQCLEDVVGRGGLQRPRHLARVARVATVVSSTVPSRPENSVAPVSETTIRRRTSSRRIAVSGTPPRVTSSSTSGAQRPSRSASAAASSGWSLTTAVISPGLIRSPVRASASSAPAGGGVGRVRPGR